MNVPISTTIERMEMMMPKMNYNSQYDFTDHAEAIYPNQATKVMRVEPTTRK